MDPNYLVPKFADIFLDHFPLPLLFQTTQRLCGLVQLRQAQDAIFALLQTLLSKHMDSHILLK